AARGRDYWRSLEELADTPGFGVLLEREFPRQAGEWTDPVSRRQFLRLAAASLALAGLRGCAQAPPERILPYVRQPDEIIPGRPRVRILTETVTSPSLLHQLRTVLQRFPNARWHRYEPAGSDNARIGAWHAFGEHVDTHYRLDRADVILALDADFLSCGPNHL